MSHNDPLQELSDALSITPSPEFAARVRQHIVSTPRRTALWPWHGLAAAAALVVVTSALVARWPTRSDTAPAPLPAPANISTTVPMAPAPAMAQSPDPGPTPRRVAADTPFAETLVPDDQLMALVRLLGAIRTGQGAVPDLVIDEDVDDEGHRAPRALVIEPLKVQPIK